MPSLTEKLSVDRTDIKGTVEKLLARATSPSKLALLYPGKHFTKASLSDLTNTIDNRLGGLHLECVPPLYCPWGSMTGILVTYLMNKVILA